MSQATDSLNSETERAATPLKSSTIPFDPRNTPFFYGWIVVAAGATGILFSVPGQTIGVSVFTDHLLEALKIKRVELSSAYMLGTLLSALMLPRAGRLYDRYGARALAPLVGVLMGLVLFALSHIDSISVFLGRLLGLPSYMCALFATFLGFAAIRFLGQGMLTMISRNMTMKWFVNRRGLVNGILGVCVAVGYSSLTFGLNTLVETFGWSGAWQICGLLLAVVFASFSAVFYRDSPQDCGMEPDGGEGAGSAKKRVVELLDGADLSQAKGYYEFWAYCAALALPALTVTAVTFHIVSIFETSGYSRAQAVGVFIPTAILSASAILIIGWISDKRSLRSLLIAISMAQALFSCGVLLLGTTIGIPMLIMGMGLSQSIFGLLIGIVWPRLFGLRHLGEIAGFGSAAGVFGSALGPVIFGLSFDFSGSYTAAAIICLILSVLLGFSALRCRA